MSWPVTDRRGGGDLRDDRGMYLGVDGPRDADAAPSS